MANPTGEQFELTRGGARAVVTEIGAGLRAFEINGVPYVETFDAADEPPKAAGQVLLPWPNRTRGARWAHDGEVQELEATEPERGNAIHGLVRHREWQVLEHGESFIRLEVDITGEPGWPVPLHTEIVYDLAPRGLVVTHEVANTGTGAVGFGVGAHPYPRLGDTPTDELTLTLPATRVRPHVDDGHWPFGEETDVAGTDHDLRGGRIVGGLDLDTVYGGLRPGADGLHHHLLSHRRTTLDLWAGPDFGWAQVFTPSRLGDRGRAVAVEPMTCPPDALNSGTDLITLEPGQTWRGSWGIRVDDPLA